ncbi:uncharacterized protein LOC125674046 [Ostrea edulis]|uniref:uncharacterized protein LOC125674046 n=1 Tax=Ostrea edulis TaxID=37623 RepID=UPI0024AFB07A|nr:uncharacterized protein LOC125674046 [Ostrea edulis]
MLIYRIVTNILWQIIFIETKRPSPPVLERVTYLSLSDLQKSIHVKDLHGWSILKTDDNILVFGMYDQTSRSLEKTITVDINLNVIVRFGEVLLKNKETNLRKISISKFLQEIDNIRKCAGLPDGSYKENCFRFVSTVVRNVKPEVETVVRSQRCSGGLISDESTPVCSACTSLRGSASDGKSSTMQITIHPKTPLSRLSKEDLIKEVKASKYSFREIQAQVQSLTNGMTETVTNEVGEGLYSSIENNPPEDNFLELFWKEQKKAFQSNPKGMRWHPMMIRFAIFLQYQSSRAYEAIKESGVLKLPNKSTLRDYTNVITPATGFQPHVFEELRKIAADLPSEKRFVALLHDEMKIKSDLVYDRRSGQVIGFTNPDTWTFNEDESMKIATHVLVFMVVGINSHIKMSIGHFPTRTSTADELYPLFWSVVAYLVMTCELKVWNFAYLYFDLNKTINLNTRPI